MHFLYFFIFFCCAQLHGMGWNSFSIPTVNGVKIKPIYKSENIKLLALLNEADEKEAFYKVPELQSIDIKLIKVPALYECTARLLYCNRLLQSANREELLEGIKLFDDVVAEKNFQLLDHYGMPEVVESLKVLITKEKEALQAYKHYYELKPALELVSISLKQLKKDDHDGLFVFNGLLDYAQRSNNLNRSNLFQLVKFSGLEHHIKKLADEDNHYARAVYGKYLADLSFFYSREQYMVNDQIYMNHKIPELLKEAPPYLESTCEHHERKQEIDVIRANGYKLLGTACWTFEKSNTSKLSRKYLEQAFNLGCFDAAYSIISLYWSAGGYKEVKNYCDAALVKKFVDVLEQEFLEKKNLSKFSVESHQIENLLGKIYFAGDEWLGIKKDYRKAKKYLQPVADMAPEVIDDENREIMLSAAIVMAEMLKHEKNNKNSELKEACKKYYLKAAEAYPQVYYTLSELYYKEKKYQNSAEMFLKAPFIKEYIQLNKLKHIDHILKLRLDESKLENQTFINLSKKYTELIPNLEKDLQKAENISSILHLFAECPQQWSIYKSDADKVFKQLINLTEKNPNLKKNVNFKKWMEALQTKYQCNIDNQTIELKKQIIKK